MTWDELESQCRNCTKCPLHETRQNVVFGAGAPEAEVLFIGEGPGEQEDIRGLPFVGRAGKLLDDMLKIISLSRELNIFIANTVKCRPPNNRDPHTAEREACKAWLNAQIDIINPKIIVCLGRISAGEIIGGDFKISRDHGKWYEINGRQVMALYHPAALLRDPNRRPDTFVDLKKLEGMIKQICTSTY